MSETSQPFVLYCPPPPYPDDKHAIRILDPHTLDVKIHAVLPHGIEVLIGRCVDKKPFFFFVG